MKLNVLAKKGIGPEKEPENEEEKQYVDILNKKLVRSSKRVVTSDSRIIC